MSEGRTTAEERVSMKRWIAAVLAVPPEQYDGTQQIADDMRRLIAHVDALEAEQEALRACLAELEYHEREGHTGISVAANDARAALGEQEVEG